MAVVIQPLGSVGYFFFPCIFLLAAQRAFINCDRRRRPDAVIPPRRVFAVSAFPALKRAQRARAAAANFVRAAADRPRRPPVSLLDEVVTLAPGLPTKLLSRRCSASILRRIDNACSKSLVDRFMTVFDRIRASELQAQPVLPETISRRGA